MVNAKQGESARANCLTIEQADQIGACPSRLRSVLAVALSADAYAAWIEEVTPAPLAGRGHDLGQKPDGAALELPSRPSCL